METKDKKPSFTKDHYGKWVAFSAREGKILDYAEELSSLSKKFGTKDVVYTKPLDPSRNYAF